jgi:hypothetical protein
MTICCARPKRIDYAYRADATDHELATVDDDFARFVGLWWRHPLA